MYSYAIYKGDYSKIEKLIKLNDVNTFWDDVRKLTKRVTNDRSIRRWQILSEIRYEQLQEETK